MPNRRAHITPSIVLGSAAMLKTEHIDSKQIASLDNFILTLYLAGPSKSEWCQNKTESGQTQTFAKNIDGSNKAFVYNDIIFGGKKGVPIGLIS